MKTFVLKTLFVLFAFTATAATLTSCKDCSPQKYTLEKVTVENGVEVQHIYDDTLVSPCDNHNGLNQNGSFVYINGILQTGSGNTGTTAGQYKFVAYLEGVPTPLECQTYYDGHTVKLNTLYPGNGTQYWPTADLADDGSGHIDHSNVFFSGIPICAKAFGMGDSEAGIPWEYGCFIAKRDPVYTTQMISGLLGKPNTNSPGMKWYYAVELNYTKNVMQGSTKSQTISQGSANSMDYGQVSTASVSKIIGWVEIPTNSFKVVEKDGKTVLQKGDDSTTN